MMFSSRDTPGSHDDLTVCHKYMTDESEVFGELEFHDKVLLDRTNVPLAPTESFNTPKMSNCSRKKFNGSVFVPQANRKFKDITVCCEDKKEGDALVKLEWLPTRSLERGAHSFQRVATPKVTNQSRTKTVPQLFVPTSSRLSLDRSDGW